VAAAKQNGFLLTQLRPTRSTFVLPNGTSIQIAQVWLEQAWSYDCQQHKNVPREGRQILISFRDSPGLMRTYAFGAQKRGSYGSHGEITQIWVGDDTQDVPHKLFVFSLDPALKGATQVVDSLYLEPVGH